MDLRSVLNTDGSSTPPRHETRPTKQGSWAAPAVPSPGERDPHPPYQRPSLSLPMAAVLSQPQPQQPPPPLLSASSYGPLRSPFESQQHSLSAGPYLQNPHVSPGVPMMPPRGESLGHSPGPSPYSQVHHPGPPSRPLASPFRPTPTMSSARTSPPPPPLVRAQSIPTTGPYQQTQGYSFHQPPVREGSVVSQPSQQITIQSLAQQSPVYSPQNTRASLPPPSMPYMQASPQPVHPSASSDYTNYRQSSPWNGHDVGVSSDHRDIVSSVPQTPVSRQNSDTLRKRPVTPEKDLSPSVKRNRSSSINVSPKTRLGNAASPTERDLHSKNPAQPEKSKQDNQVTERMNSTGSDPPDSRQSEVSNKQPAGSTTATWTGYPPATPKPSHQKFSNGPKTASPVSTEQIRSKSSVSNMTDQPSETSAAADLPPPKKRRTRYEEPPIFARRAPRRYGHPPQIPLHLSRNSGMNHQEATPSASSRRETSQVPAPSPTPALEASSLFPTVTGVIPYEEVSRTICDFLFNHVVRRRDIGVGNTGGSAPGQGAVIEIEAKLGKLIDRNRGARLHLPVMTECVLDREDPGLRVSFESSMTLTQHRTLNKFLNDAVYSSFTTANQTSNPNPTAADRDRTPSISYAHKKERDTFYEINPAALPPVIQHNLPPRHKPRVRVTTDQRTNEVLARIVKCRVADLNVYSPRTCLDWRVSVNLEMNYDGDMSELIPIPDVGGGSSRRGGGVGSGSGHREKDRMSYRHLAYQIDLTQVGTSENNFEHELEVELSPAEVRRQGDLLLAGELHQYDKLVEGFVNNVRILARHVPAG